MRHIAAAPIEALLDADLTGSEATGELLQQLYYEVGNAASASLQTVVQADETTPQRVSSGVRRCGEAGFDG